MADRGVVVSGTLDLTVLLLCGGKGDRLQPLTQDTPKPLVPLRGRPILDYLVSSFVRFGFRRFVVAVGYRAEKVVAYFEENHRALEVRIVDSGDVDIVARIREAARGIDGDFIVCYGDTLADVDIPALIGFQRGHPGALAITSHPLQTQFGLLEIEADGRVSEFREKPVLDKWINIGYYCFPQSLVPKLEGHADFVSFLRERVAQGELYSFRHTGLHITVNTLTEYHEAEKNIGRFEERLGERR